MCLFYSNNFVFKATVKDLSFFSANAWECYVFSIFLNIFIREITIKQVSQYSVLRIINPKEKHNCALLNISSGYNYICFFFQVKILQKKTIKFRKLLLYFLRL